MQFHRNSIVLRAVALAMLLGVSAGVAQAQAGGTAKATLTFQIRAPLSISFNPAAPAIDCAPPAGTVLAAVGTAGGSGTPVSLSLTGGDTADFALSGSNIVVGANGIAPASLRRDADPDGKRDAALKGTPGVSEAIAAVVTALHLPLSPVLPCNALPGTVVGNVAITGGDGNPVALALTGDVGDFALAAGPNGGTDIVVAAAGISPDRCGALRSVTVTATQP